MRLSWLVLAGLFPGAACGVPAAEPMGSLVMVGGGLRASNLPVHEAFLSRSGDGMIGIIPLASSKPAETAARFRSRLLELGVDGSRIKVLPLAVVDDSSTVGIDESSWSRNGENAALVEEVDALTAVWFTGGDQARIVEALVRPSGEDSAVLAAIRHLYERGGVVGGTSAGAAVQSVGMILGGSSPEALRHGPVEGYSGMEAQEDGPLRVGRGLGFFPHGLIDQHFDRKARLGRLIVAIPLCAADDLHGYGIDEDTALVYDAASLSGEVVGLGTVTKVDLTASLRSGEGWSGIRISVLTPGDRIVWPGAEITISPDMQPTIGREYLSLDHPRSIGLLSPYGGRLEDALGFLLLDNASSTVMESPVQSLDGSRFLLRFSQDDRSRGFWASSDGEYVRYSSVDVLLEIDRLD